MADTVEAALRKKRGRAAKDPMQAMEASRERRRERDRIRTHQRRMAKKGFHVDVGDLSKLTTAQLKKMTTASLSRKAYATTGKWAGKMTYHDYQKMGKKSKKKYEETGEVPKKEETKYKRRKGKTAAAPAPAPKPKQPEPVTPEPKKPEPLVPTIGEVLLEELEKAIEEGMRTGPDPLIAASIRDDLQEAIRRYGRVGTGIRLLNMHNHGIFLPLIRYITKYISRGEEHAARYVFDQWSVYMFDTEPTTEEQRYWDDQVVSDGVMADPETGEVIM